MLPGLLKVILCNGIHVVITKRFAKLYPRLMQQTCLAMIAHDGPVQGLLMVWYMMADMYHCS